MLPGPVFTFEIMTSSRRPRFYAARAVYAAMLLLILWMIYSLWSSSFGTDVPSRMIRWFGLSTLGGIVVGQGLLVLLLTPALVSGAIADEKRRKTLHYLLASRLTGPEIVLGKLMVRMLYLGVLLGVSFPVMSLLVLLGGIDPALVVLCAGGLLSMAWFLAALSIWVSTIARRPREALFVTFSLEILWLSLPAIIRYGSVQTGLPWLDDALELGATWVGASGPVFLVENAITSLVMGGRNAWQAPFVWMIGLQSAAGVVLALVAAVQLRPIFKRQDGGRPAEPRAPGAAIGASAPIASAGRRASDALEGAAYQPRPGLRPSGRLAAHGDSRRPPAVRERLAGPRRLPREDGD